MADRVGAELATSMLDAAGSLHQLQEELDRISLRYCSSAASSPSRKKSHKKKKKKKVSVRGSGSRDDVTSESYGHDTISLESCGSCEQASSLSSSSRFDSAIGSLPSQTDDSLSSQHSIRPNPARLPRSELHASYSPSLLTHRTTAAEHSNVVTVEQYFSPQPSIPTLVTASEHTATEEGTSLAGCKVQSGGRGLDCITVMGTQVQLRRKTNREKLQTQHTPETNRRHFKWLDESTDSEEEPAVVDTDTCSGARGAAGDGGGGGGGGELESGASSSTVVAEETGGYTAVDFSTGNFTPMKREDQTTLEVNQPLHGGSHLPSRHVSMPQDRSTGLMEEEKERRRQQRQPPRRNASILQRLRRRRGSFQRDRRPRRQTPVQRSLSDRFVYHLKRRWEGQDQEELNIISMPSLPRPIGRLLRTYAGRLHVIQLHKPADGRYGIYISQEANQKIFISRFATATAEKFYAGLLRPGDEIVSVNKQKIRGYSLDSVYALLSELDSVIIAVVPVTAHRNW